MPLKTEETFQLQAPADRVWAYLIDPRQVVQCLPGAELTAVQDESTFLGKVKVKVGPIVAAYSGKVVITERDDAARVVRMVGEGRESTGGGSAKVSITSTVAALPGGGSEVRVTADLDIVGKIAQFGRGMIESVNKQMFRQFTECVRSRLETPVAASPAGVPNGDAGAPASGPPSRGVASGLAAEGVTAGDRDPMMGAAAAPASLAGVGALPPAAAADATRVGPGVAPPTYVTAQPVRLLPLIGRAIWESITALFRRLLGRRSDASR